MKTLLVLDPDDGWIANALAENQDRLQIVTPTQYLSGAVTSRGDRVRVCNLCRGYRYQSMGYYVSLLAEARGHRPFPDVLTIGDLSLARSVRMVPDGLEDLIQKSLSPLASDDFILSVYFGENLAKRYERLARSIYSQFNAPLIRCRFKRRKKTWRLAQVSAIAVSDVPDSHRDFVAEAARRHFDRVAVTKANYRPPRYDLAILHNPDEGDLAPSCETALKRLIKAAAREDMRAELVTVADAGRLFEFDALLIRETTSVNHHTYRLARRAESAGMVVIDDPTSILRCTNKVYLAELMQRAKIPAPPTTIIHRSNAQDWIRQADYPCVLKRPDSAFSQGVSKAENANELERLLHEYLSDSELVIAQPFMKTDFDWRIGLLDGEALFACKYYMAKGHWQIAKHGDASAKTRFGKCETIPVELAPKKCVILAKKAAGLIGNGFYGVDIKESDGEFYVIEVNDNPNLDAGVEDKVLGVELYRRIVRSLVRRLNRE
ncbi:RimK family protein [Crateriforma conspicua]|uniref:Carbamoyl phosphate synthase-like protein n=1 Tax=Crateriforma conspicua TaxID=2527996 RepID=A0A5C5Y960_9PLAN|nr:RimK family protein [Crateriforma conspicua]QDV61860.1 Ribosomal protein S6 modification protein [Crateriforma conspicua]TWT71890.1 carbamoyl phosphate synthase-like protein [Crateriforma conspicua]